VAAITRDADRKQPVATATDFLAKRRVHDGDAAVRFGWTRRANRGTRETTGSVRRSIEAVTEGLEISAPGPHLDPPQVRQPISSHPRISRGALGGPGVRAFAQITTAAERLHGSSMTVDVRGDLGCVVATSVQIYAV
jgi:hypothetical protein